jgi:hypothetical protein
MVGALAGAVAEEKPSTMPINMTMPAPCQESDTYALMIGSLAITLCSTEHARFRWRDQPALQYHCGGKPSPCQQQ